MNKYSIEREDIVDNFKHVMKIMRISFSLLFFCIFFSQAAPGFSQETELSLHLRSASIIEVCEEIEKKSDFRFIFAGNDQTIFNKKIDLSTNSGNIEKILDTILSDTDLSYRIMGNQVVIYQEDNETDSNEIANLLSEQITQQSDRFNITGKVTDAYNDEPLPGVNVVIAGTSLGTTTDIDGVYDLLVNEGDTLIFSFIGFVTQKIEVEKVKIINVRLSEHTEMLEEAVVVAFGKQSKESVVSSITTVNTKDLKVPSSNLTTALSGKMAGLISYQTTGAPGEEDAQFFVRSVTSFGSGLTSPLILIDNIEMTSKDLSKLNPDDIASFSILKDASATALYGARGANGVVLVTTKEGVKGAVKVQFRYESSLSTPTTKVDVADPVTFMEYSNIANMTRHGELSYSQSKIQSTKDPNRNQYVYPAVDWKDMLTKNHSMNHRANINLTGGGEAATYYLAGSFSQDNGILQVDQTNPFNTNISLKKYSVRSNVNLNLTRSLEAKVRVSANFDDYTGPMGESGSGGAHTYGKTLLANPVLFPAYYQPDHATQYVDRILFGNYSDSEYGEGAPNYLNPYADIMKGYEDVRNNTLLAQLELHQNLNMITEGLRARFIGSVTRYSGFNIQRSYEPFYYQYIKGTYNPGNANFPYELAVLNPEEGSDYIEYSAGNKFVRSTSYAEGAILYNRKFDKIHDVGGLLVGSFKESMDGSPVNLDSSLPSRNVSLAGRLTYGFDQTYFAEFNFGLNGSERFDPSHRWGFFPSIGAGWQVSQESFWSGLKHTIPQLKIRATYGLVGNDVIVSDRDRFFFTSNIDLNGPNAGYFGNDPYQTFYRPTINISRYANPDITWEISYKTNLAIELGLLDNDLTFQAEFYHEKRTNIVQFRPDIPSTTGLTAGVRTNYGEAVGKGVDLTLDYSKAFANSMWYILRGNFTYGTAKITKYDELDYSGIAPWRSFIGQKVGQTRGYVAERLFIDDDEVRNSPLQQVSSGGGDYQAGDIKYRDINGDGVINEFDIVPMGYPSNPEIQFGLGGSFGYKDFDFSLFFQGSSRYSFFLNASSMAPFVEVYSDGKKGNRAMLNFIAESVWTETDRDIYAKWPRLSPDTGSASFGNNNNFVNSNYWMRSASYIRLKSVEVGYSIPEVKGVTPRIYASGTNLFTLSNFKLWDPEMRGNGLGYPIQKVFNLGIQLNF
ncbi:MAG: SusC/RagA family TonB-linked outer membrane protein [Paludibacter sp.]|nr:SusC/RagA family TonB-linked outer membrane protein [Paludibacter sp.]